MRYHIIVSLLAVVASPLFVRAEVPRYRWQPNSQLVYQVEITADSPLETDTMSGYVVFDVVSPSDPLKIKYKGGLTKTSKKKPGTSSGGGGPFGDPFGAGGGNPFARQVNPFQGLEQTTNEIVITPTGEILTVTGSSQLPYLLGNLSLLFFEPLPESDLKTWKLESGIVITEKSEQRGRADFFDPFARPRGNEQDKQSAGGQSTSFTLEGERNGLAVYQRSYRLNSPGDSTSFTIDGSGQWTFNRSLGMSESLDIKQTLKIKSDNVEFSVPVSIKYHRLSNDEWAKMEAARIEAERPKSEEEVYRAAVAKLSAGGTPSSAEVEKIVAATKANLKPILDQAYGSANEVNVLGPWVTYDTPLPKGLVVAANMYAQPETKYFPGTIDSILENGLIRVRYSYQGGATGDRLREDIFIAPEVVEQKQLTPEQITELQAYRERVKQEMASSPDGPETTEQLIRSYRDGTQPVVKVGDPVPDGLPLPKFMVVAAKRGDKWYQAHVSAVQSDGMVAVRFSCDSADTNVARSDLRLPPPEVKAPNLPPNYKTSPPPISTAPSSTSPTSGNAFRTWTDSTGKFKVEAKYVGEAGDSVQIVRKDGKQLTLPLNRLSKPDQDYVLAQRKSENPFE